MIGRVGTFLIVLGAFAFILFLASDFNNAPDFDYLFGAMFILSLGWLLQRRRPPPASAGRFGIFRSARESARKRREEQEKAKLEKEKKK